MIRRFSVGLILLALCACQGPQELVVLSYNIHHGEGTDGKFDLPRIAQVILDSGADLVALQEVDVATRRASGVDQAAELARLTGMHVAFGRAIEYSGGEYGDAVLSRFPIEDFERIALPARPDHEARVAVVATVLLPQSSQAIRFVSTHLDHTKDPGDRIAQAHQLLKSLFPVTQVIVGLDGFSGAEALSQLPTLVVGDLNAQPDSQPMNILLKRLDSAAPPGALTFPASQPEIQIDWILMSADHPWRVIDVDVLGEQVASDHRPLRATLTLGNSR